MDREIVRVLSRRAPTLSWHCSKCHGASTFECSELFRVNANGKLIDIWLTYRCRRCEKTRNLTVVERTPVRRIPAAIFEAAQINDARTARRFARDLALVRRGGARLAEGDDCFWAALTMPLLGRDTDVELVVQFPEPLLVRFDRVAADLLTIPRNKLRSLIDAGAVTIARPSQLHRFELHDAALISISPSPPLQPPPGNGTLRSRG